jgi:DNA-binding transcriptional MerR regulator
MLVPVRESLLTISEFAARSGLTQKALRLYAANGLLTPTRVDSDSGYRYYRSEQLPVAALISTLREAGMSMREIARFLVDRDDAVLERQDARLEHRREALQVARQMIEEAEMFEVELQEAPAQRYVSRTQRVKVDELERFIVETTRELGGGVGAFTIYHGQVNETDDGPVEVCVPREDGDRALPAQPIAVTLAEGEDCDFPRILEAYDAIVRWANEHGRSLAGPPREVCLQEEPLRLQVAWPLA